MARRHPTLMRKIATVFLTSIVTISGVSAGNPKSPLFVCVELPPSLQTSSVSETVLNIENALNVSGVFLATDAKKLEGSNPQPAGLDIDASVNATRVLNAARSAPSPVSVSANENIRPSETSANKTESPRNSAAAAVFVKDAKLEPSPGRPLSSSDVELLFQKTLVTVCKSAFPDLETREPHSTPFRHRNCSVICVYGHPPVEIPDGEMCYLQINFIGTPGRCQKNECVISGDPFEFHPVPKKNPESRPLFEPAFKPNVHLPSAPVVGSSRKR